MTSPTDLRLYDSQPDTSPSCWTRETESVCRTVCLFTPPAYAGTKLYRFVTEANVCERLAQGRTSQRSGWDRTRDLQSQVQRPCQCVASHHSQLHHHHHVTHSPEYVATARHRSDQRQGSKRQNPEDCTDLI